MHVIDDYECKLETKLIEKFKDDFYEKMGYYPVIFSKYTLDVYHKNIVISLEELSDIFKDFLPKIPRVKVTLSNKSKIRKLVELRVIFCFLARTMKYTLKEIAVFLNRDHTSVVHALQSFNDFIETDPDFKLLFDKINTIYRLKLKKYESSDMDKFDQISVEPEPTVLLRLLQIQDKTFADNRRNRRIQNSKK